MVKSSKSLVASRALTYSGRNGKTHITIHETANTDPGAGAETHARLQQNGFTASWHWSVDDREAIQSFPHNVRCWHAGDGDAPNGGNYNSIGIEICVNSDGDFTKAVKNAAQLVKKIMKQEGIPLSNVVQHNHWSGKHCPTNLRNGSKGITWNQFKNMISGSGGKTTYTPPKKQTGSTSTSASGRVESKVNGLRFYNKPSWADKDVVGRVDKGIGFPTIVKKVKVGKGHQYQVKNSKGATYYITAADKYVRVEGGSVPKANKPAPKKSASNSGKAGKLKVVGVSNAAIVMSKPDRNNSSNLGTVNKGSTLPLNGSVRGKNSSSGYWEVQYKGRLGYITGKYGKQV